MRTRKKTAAGANVKGQSSNVKVENGGGGGGGGGGGPSSEEEGTMVIVEEDISIKEEVHVGEDDQSYAQMQMQGAFFGQRGGGDVYDFDAWDSNAQGAQEAPLLKKKKKKTTTVVVVQEKGGRQQQRKRKKAVVVVTSPPPPPPVSSKVPRPRGVTKEKEAEVIESSSSSNNSWLRRRAQQTNERESKKVVHTMAGIALGLCGPFPSPANAYFHPIVLDDGGDQPVVDIIDKPQEKSRSRRKQTFKRKGDDDGNQEQVNHDTITTKKKKTMPSPDANKKVTSIVPVSPSRVTRSGLLLSRGSPPPPPKKDDGRDVVVVTRVKVKTTSDLVIPSEEDKNNDKPKSKPKTNRKKKVQKVENKDNGVVVTTTVEESAALFQCGLCPKTFPHLKAFEGHLRRIHRVSEKRALANHQSSCLSSIFHESLPYEGGEGEEPVVAEDKKKEEEDGLLPIHHDCSLCGRAFKTPGGLIQHYRTHRTRDGVSFQPSATSLLNNHQSLDASDKGSQQLSRWAFADVGGGPSPKVEVRSLIPLLCLGPEERQGDDDDDDFILPLVTGVTTQYEENTLLPPPSSKKLKIVKPPKPSNKVSSSSKLKKPCSTEYQCPQCGTCLSNDMNLARHIRNFHGTETNSVRMINASFSNLFGIAVSKEEEEEEEEVIASAIVVVEGPSPPKPPTSTNTTPKMKSSNNNKARPSSSSSPVMNNLKTRTTRQSERGSSCSRGMMSSVKTH